MRLAVHLEGGPISTSYNLLVSDERTHFSDNYFDLECGTRSGQQLGECIGLCRELLRIDLPMLLQILQLPLQAVELF